MHKLCMGMCGEGRGLRTKPRETAALQSGSEEAVKGETEGEEKERPRGSCKSRKMVFGAQSGHAAES